MNKVKIDFENCYGIKKLKYEFDFSEERRAVIYAPNGAMKTSFATVFRDLSEDKVSEDRIFKNRETKRSIKNEHEVDIASDQIFVIEPYSESYKSSKISTLLANKKLKDKYDGIYKDIDEKKEALVKELKNSSGLKGDIEAILATDIAHDSKEFFKSLIRVQAEVAGDKKTALGDILYQKIFNEKVLSFIEAPDFQDKLSRYMKTYDELVSASTFFKKGIFNHNNAADIAKNLKENGFFEADHSIYVTADKVKKEIKTKTDLEKVIQQERDSILKNVDLAKSFDEIDKVLNKNREAKEFRDYLEENQGLLPELANLPRLKERLWISYLVKNIEAYKLLMDVYDKAKEHIEKIIEEAKKETTKWAEVINVFNERFSVPFRVLMENQEDVILKSSAPSIKFKFKESEISTDTNTDIDIAEKELWDVLSNGERRALYLLNIIFEVNARKELGVETLFVIDDIADSFDYKNKYAIIEYLSDISEHIKFYQVILTHNFDFFRTISGRLNIRTKLHTVKTDTGIKLVPEKYPKNPFTMWKKKLGSSEEMLVASIPFIRNLTEFCDFGNLENNEDYQKLTELLHLRPGTDSITIGDLGKIIKNVLKGAPDLPTKDQERSVKELIYSLARKIFSETEDVIDLEKKIVLSIAIRLKTEELLIGEINDDVFVLGIDRYQTITLIRKYKEKFPNNREMIKLAEQVNLMTPENIHINSFMYEPILDMSNTHLKQLYGKVFDFSAPKNGQTRQKSSPPVGTVKA